MSKENSINHCHVYSRAQATLEFVFAFIVLVFIFFSAVKALQWLGVVLASSTNQYRDGLFSYPSASVGASTENPYFDPIEQLKAADAKIILPRLKLTFDGAVFNQP